jgi:hypothetical protein
MRHQLFAQRVITEPAHIERLYAETNTDELQRIVMFLHRFKEAGTEPFQNGARLTLRRKRHSVMKMLDEPRGPAAVKPVSEEPAESARRVLRSPTRSD